MQFHPPTRRPSKRILPSHKQQILLETVAAAFSKNELLDEQSSIDPNRLLKQNIQILEGMDLG